MPRPYTITSDEKKRIQEWEEEVDAEIYRQQVENGFNNPLRFQPFIDAFGRSSKRASGLVPRYGASGGVYIFQFRYLEIGYVLTVRHRISKDLIEVKNNCSPGEGETAMQITDINDDEVKDIEQWQMTDTDSGRKEDYVYEVIPSGLGHVRRIINMRDKTVLTLPRLLESGYNFTMACPSCGVKFTVYAEITPLGSKALCLHCDNSFTVPLSVVNPSNADLEVE